MRVEVTLTTEGNEGDAEASRMLEAIKTAVRIASEGCEGCEACQPDAVVEAPTPSLLNDLFRGADDMTQGPDAPVKAEGRFFDGSRLRALAVEVLFLAAQRRSPSSASKESIERALNAAAKMADAERVESDRPFLDWLFNGGGLERILELFLKILPLFL